MPRWSVVGSVTASKYLGEFEADTKEQAELLALESDSAAVSICHNCTSECEDPSIETAEASLVE